MTKWKTLLLLPLLLSFQAFAYDTGTADQVYRMSHTGTRPIFGAIDVTKAAAVTGESAGACYATGSSSALLFGTLPVADGGTGIASGTSGGVVYFSASGVISSSAAMTQYGVLVGGGAGAAPSPVPVPSVSATPYPILTAPTPNALPVWNTIPGNTNFLKPPTVSVATASGTGTGGFGASQTGWLFTVTGWTGTLAIGDTYTNNGHTYTAILGQTNGASGQTLFMSGTSATSGGTLTKAVSASGPATITFSANTAYYTYTTPTSPSPIALKIHHLIGAGGGGGGSGTTTTGGTGGTGGTTFFGSLILIATGGTGGTNESTGNSGTGGTATVNAGATQMLALSGGYGGGMPQVNGTTTFSGGAPGANSPFGGAGSSNNYVNATFGNATANTGSGGAGGYISNSTALYMGLGGGSGAYIEAIINSSIASVYPYIVGAAGAAGAIGSGTGAAAGGTGGSGVISIEEVYQ